MASNSSTHILDGPPAQPIAPSLVEARREMLALLLPDLDVAARPVVVDPASLLETPEPFRKWLAGQPATVLVGRAGSLRFDPIANFLTAQGLSDVVVGPHVVRWDWLDKPRAEAPLYDLPVWATEFVHKLDGRFVGMDVPAACARALLAEVAP